jgi:hypothetical protein
MASDVVERNTSIEQVSTALVPKFWTRVIVARDSTKPPA